MTKQISARQIATAAIEVIKSTTPKYFESHDIKACHISTAARRWAKAQTGGAFGDRTHPAWPNYVSVVVGILFVGPNTNENAVYSLVCDVCVRLGIDLSRWAALYGPAVETAPAVETVESTADEYRLLSTYEIATGCDATPKEIASGLCKLMTAARSNATSRTQLGDLLTCARHARLFICNGNSCSPRAKYRIRDFIAAMQGLATGHSTAC